MLILVGVTISYTLNGGIITKAKDAAEQTQVEAEKEELLLAVFGTVDNNGEVNIADLTISGWNKSAAKQDSESKTYYEFTSANENTFYVYDTTGKISSTEPTQGSTPVTSTFDWGDYGLEGVDTSAEYVLSPGGDLEYVMTFSQTGVYNVTQTGTGSVDTLDLSDASTISTYSVTHTSNSLSYVSTTFGNVTLVLNSNNIDATLSGATGIPDGTYTYVKQ